VTRCFALTYQATTQGEQKQGETQQGETKSRKMPGAKNVRDGNKKSDKCPWRKMPVAKNKQGEKCLPENAVAKKKKRKTPGRKMPVAKKASSRSIRFAENRIVPLPRYTNLDVREFNVCTKKNKKSGLRKETRTGLFFIRIPQKICPGPESLIFDLKIPGFGTGFRHRCPIRSDFGGRI
jgi:hypothetical protein